MRFADSFHRIQIDSDLFGLYHQTWGGMRSTGLIIHGPAPLRHPLRSCTIGVDSDQTREGRTYTIRLHDHPNREECERRDRPDELERTAYASIILTPNQAREIVEKLSKKLEEVENG